MKKNKSKLSESYVKVFKKYPGENYLTPGFEKAPPSLSKEVLENYMMKSYLEHEKNLQRRNPSANTGKALRDIQAAAFASARADVLSYVHTVLETNPVLKSDVMGGGNLVDKTSRSQLVFTSKDYRDDYSYANVAKHPFNPDPRLLPMQSFERVLKVPQDDILGLTKGVAMFDPSPNSQAIDDYVNRVIDDTKKTES